MNTIMQFLYHYALSIFLIIMAVLAIRFVYKHWKKFEKNQFE
ncbi:hypothetical protein [Paenibacillus sp. HJGM_3]